MQCTLSLLSEQLFSRKQCKKVANSFIWFLPSRHLLTTARTVSHLYWCCLLDGICLTWHVALSSPVQPRNGYFPQISIDATARQSRSRGSSCAERKIRLQRSLSDFQSMAFGSPRFEALQYLPQRSIVGGCAAKCSFHGWHAMKNGHSRMGECEKWETR